MKLNYTSLTNENYEKYSNVPVVIENYEEDNIIEGLEGLPLLIGAYVDVELDGLLPR